MCVCFCSFPAECASVRGSRAAGRRVWADVFDVGGQQLLANVVATTRASLRVPGAFLVLVLLEISLHDYAAAVFAFDLLVKTFLFGISAGNREAAASRPAANLGEAALLDYVTMHVASLQLFLAAQSSMRAIGDEFVEQSSDISGRTVRNLLAVWLPAHWARPDRGRRRRLVAREQALLAKRVVAFQLHRLDERTLADGADQVRVDRGDIVERPEVDFYVFGRIVEDAVRDFAFVGAIIDCRCRCCQAVQRLEDRGRGGEKRS